jgi:hypothetical protein
MLLIPNVMKRPSRQQLVLISGCPRSGTTLLNLLLNSDPCICITNEYNLVRIVELLKSSPIFNRSKKVNKLPERPKSARENWKNTDLVKFIPTYNKSIKLLIEALCCSIKTDELNQCSNNLMVVGDKLPTYYNEDLSSLIELYKDDLKVIHISRRPAEVVSSALRRTANAKKGLDSWAIMTSAESAVSEWITAWNWAVEISNHVETIHLNYNQLILDTEQSVSVLSEFLSLDLTLDTSLIDSTPLSINIGPSEIMKISQAVATLDAEWDQFQIMIEAHCKIPALKDKTCTKNHSSGKKFISAIKSIFSN